MTACIVLPNEATSNPHLLKYKFTCALRDILVGLEAKTGGFNALTASGRAILQAPFVLGRKKGQPRGAQANSRRAVRAREILSELAATVWDQRPELRNNWSATAREIMNMTALKLEGVSHLGFEAVRKHLSKAGKAGRF